MNARLEKLIVPLLLVLFFITLANTIVLSGFSLTKEEAVEIGRRSEAVQHYIEWSENRYSLEVRYLNSTQVDELIREYPENQQVYPENRSVWTVMWYFHGGIGIFQVIEDETGQIFYESGVRY